MYSQYNGHFTVKAFGLATMVTLCLLASQSFASEGGNDPFVEKTIKEFSCSDYLVALDKDIAKEKDLRRGEIPEWKRLIKVTRTEVNRFSGHAERFQKKLDAETDVKEKKKLKKEVRYYKRAARGSKHDNNALVDKLRDAERQLEQIQDRIKTLKKARKVKKC